MSILRLLALTLATLWLDKRGASLMDSWLFGGKEIVYKHGVRVTIEMLEEGELENAWLESRVVVSEPT